MLNYVLSTRKLDPFENKLVCYQIYWGAKFLKSWHNTPLFTSQLQWFTSMWDLSIFFFFIFYLTESLHIVLSHVLVIFCYPDTNSNHLRRGRLSWEMISLWACLGYFSSYNCYRHVVLDMYLSKPVSSILPWSLFSSCLVFLLWLSW